ncbi:MAG: phosphoribosylglycinamide formyltransferase [Pirellulaceae bacterium]
MSSKFNVAVLISGGGTTLRNLIERQQADELDATIALVISSNSQAKGIHFAETAGIRVQVFDHREFTDPDSISNEIFTACREADIELVALGGFLRKLKIPNDFVNRVVNIHPSLIPAYCGAGMYGMRVHQAVIENGSPITGCTVHFVDNQFDHGPIIAQESVQVQKEESPEELAARVFELECELYPRVINAIARGEIRVDGDVVVPREPG